MGQTAIPPARVQRFALRLQPYSYTIKHVDGKINVAEDYLSRSLLPIEQKEEICYQNTEEWIQSVVLGVVRQVELVE